MKKVFLIIGNVKYEIGGGMGSWAKSNERIFYPVGTVRVIGNVLMKLCYQYKRWWTYENNWSPVDSKINEPEELRKWVNHSSGY